MIFLKIASRFPRGQWVKVTTNSPIYKWGLTKQEHTISNACTIHTDEFGKCFCQLFGTLRSEHRYQPLFWYVVPVWYISIPTRSSFTSTMIDWSIYSYLVYLFAKKKYMSCNMITWVDLKLAMFIYEVCHCCFPVAKSIEIIFVNSGYLSVLCMTELGYGKCS